MSTKPTTKRQAAKKAPKPRRSYRPGYMGKSETVPLAIAAREAFDYQLDLGNIEHGTKFDDWRHEQVHQITRRDGLRDCLHEHFRPLLAHFQLLASKDDRAFATEMRTGRASGAPGDTREAREKVVHEIRTRLAEHIRLAETLWPDYLDAWIAASKAEWTIYGDPGIPWPGLDAREVNRTILRKEAIEAGGGPLREGYLIAIARNKTRRPDLNLGRDIWSGLAERCTAKQLGDLLFTLVNRIAVREGRPESKAGRNKKQKSPAAKARRSKKTLAPRFELPLQDGCDGPA